MGLPTSAGRMKAFSCLGRLFTCSFQRNPNFPVLIAAFENSVSFLIQWLLCASPPLVDHSCVAGPPNWARIIPASANKTTPPALLNPEFFIQSSPLSPLGRATLQPQSNTETHRTPEDKPRRSPLRFR